MSNNDDFDDLNIEIEEDIVEEAPEPQRVKTPTGTRITLFFRSTIGPGEKLEKLTVNPQMKVTELKQTLSQLFGLDAGDFHLAIAGRTLDNDDIVDNYDVVDGTEVLLIPVSTAG